MSRKIDAKGLFVTFEGGEGAGKSTLLKNLSAHFLQKGFPVVSTREPGGTVFGEELRSFLLHHRGLKIEARAELFLFLAARAQHVDELIVPELNKGTLVLCDRFSDSTVAYQGIGRNLGRQMVEEACSLATQSLEPALTFFVDIDPEIGLTRTRHRGSSDRIEDEKIQFHITVRKAFLDIAARAPQRVVVLDGTLSPEALLEQAIEIIMKRWPSV